MCSYLDDETTAKLKVIDRVFHCPECDFITLQKKNLGIHLAIQQVYLFCIFTLRMFITLSCSTGEKVHECPELVTIVGSSGSMTCKERCKYKTNDPAALTKHRKKIHGYIPPPNRRRAAKAALTSPSKHWRTKDEHLSRRPRPYDRPAPVACRRPLPVSTMDNHLSSKTPYIPPHTELPHDYHDYSLLLHQENVNAYGPSASMEAGSVNAPDYNPSVSSGATLVASAGGMEYDTHYDPSLQADWIANYEMGYSTFDTTGMKYLPDPYPLHMNLSLAPAGFDQTGREGCLCPDWMVHSGIEGWGQSVLQTPNAPYQF